MKKILLTALMGALGLSLYAQLNIQVVVTKLEVTSFCDLDGFGAGDSDPQWDITVDDGRGYSRSLSHEITNNGPNITLTNGFPSLGFNITYANTCPPQALYFDWSGREDDGIGSDALSSQSFSWPIITTPGTYSYVRNLFNSACSGMNWRIEYNIIVSGTVAQLCADEPCDASTQELQDGCDGNPLDVVRYYIDEVSPTGSGNAIDGTVPGTSCAYDGTEDMFFQVDVPADADGFTIYIDDWGGCSGALCYTDITASIHSSSGDCSTSNLALGNPGGVSVAGSGGSHTAQCVDLTGVILAVPTNNSPLQVSGLTGGQTYYVRMSEEDDQGGWMDMAFQVNYTYDNCTGAVALSGEGCNYSATDLNEPDVSTWTGSAHSSPYQTCGGWSSMENAVWYYFDVDASTPQPITIEAFGVDCDNTGGGDLQMGVFYSASGSCAPEGGANSSNGLGSMQGVGCDVGTGTVSVTIPSGQPFGRYYVVCDGNAGAQCVWEFESAEVLPVELEMFEGYAEEQVNVLEWRTRSETGNSHFEVERSADPTLRDFEKIGEVSGAGTVSMAQDYAFRDEEPLTSAYYRLKQVDFDGEYEYTDVVRIIRKDKAFSLSNIYPVPTPGITNVKYEITDGKTDMTFILADMFGRVISTESATLDTGTHTKEFDLSLLPDGVYTITLSDGTDRMVGKVIKR